jgi:hypothetical protein
MILEKACEYNVDIHDCTLIISKHTIVLTGLSWLKLWKNSKHQKKLVRLVKMTLENMHNKVKIQGKLSPNFETVVGLRQDDSLSTLLFKFCMEKVIRNVKTNPGGTIFMELDNV